MTPRLHATPTRLAGLLMGSAAVAALACASAASAGEVKDRGESGEVVAETAGDRNAVFRQVFGTEPPALARGAYPVIVDGREIGTALVRPGSGEDWRVDRASLVNALEGVLKPELLVRLQEFEADAPLDRQTLGDLGVDARFDRADLALVLNVPAALRETRTITLRERRAAPAGEVSHEPAELSAALNGVFDLGATYGEVSNTQIGVLADGFVNFRGLVLEGGFRWGGDDENEFYRDDITLLWDDESEAIRYRALEFSPDRTGFQTAPTLLGVGASRVFSIRPFDVVRPVASRTLQLERPSQVEVFVNDVFVRRVTLQPGEYDFRDFPLAAERPNDVVLRVEDSFGQVETLEFDAFLDFQQLRVGVSEFSANLGAPIDRAFADRSYDFGELMFTGFYRRGLTSSLTAGVNLQLDDDSALLGGDAIWANVMGNFLINAGASTSEDLGEGFAADLEYRRTLDAIEARFDVSVSYVSEDFSPVRQDLAAATPILLDDQPITPPTDPVFGPQPPAFPPERLRNPVEWAVSASWRQRLGESWDLSTSASYNDARKGALDRWSVSAGASRRFGAGSLGVTARFESYDGETNASAQISFSMPLGRRSGLSASYDTEREAARARVYRTGSGGVGSTSYAATASHAPGSSLLEGRATYTANRYRAELEQNVISTDLSGTSGQTRARIATGVMFADGQTAIGRPARDGFAIISPADTFKEADLLVEPAITFGDEEQRFEARTGALGPAVLPNLIDYQPREVEIVPENVPPGTTLDRTDVTLRPDLRSGYRIELGGEANVAVVATLVDAAGQPVQRASGRARIEGAPEDEAAIFFTNETGRLYLDQLKPGTTYLLEIAGGRGATARFTTPEDGFGLVRPETPIRLSGDPA